MSKAFLSEWKKWDMNSDPWLEVTWEGTPCLEKTWSMNSCASCMEVIVSKVGMKIPCLERQSTMTRMDVKLEDGGSFSMKSIDIEFQGFLGIRSCLRSL